MYRYSRLFAVCCKDRASRCEVESLPFQPWDRFPHIYPYMAVSFSYCNSFICFISRFRFILQSFAYFRNSFLMHISLSLFPFLCLCLSIFVSISLSLFFSLPIYMYLYLYIYLYICTDILFYFQFAARFIGPPVLNSKSYRFSNGIDSHICVVYILFF